MDKQFLNDSLKALLPIWIILSFLYVSGHVSTDFFFHIGNRGGNEYSPFLSWVLSLFEGYRPSALFIINLIVTTLLPFILIHRITKKMDACWVYLYSGVPLILFVVWLVPQAIIHVLTLIMILNPLLGVGLFFTVGFYAHYFWWSGFFVACAYHVWRKTNEPA